MQPVERAALAARRQGAMYMLCLPYLPMPECVSKAAGGTPHLLPMAGRRSIASAAIHNSVCGRP